MRQLEVGQDVMQSATGCSIVVRPEPSQTEPVAVPEAPQQTRKGAKIHVRLDSACDGKDIQRTPPLSQLTGIGSIVGLYWT